MSLKTWCLPCGGLMVESVDPPYFVHADPDRICSQNVTADRTLMTPVTGSQPQHSWSLISGAPDTNTKTAGELGEVNSSSVTLGVSVTSSPDTTGA